MAIAFHGDYTPRDSRRHAAIAARPGVLETVARLCSAAAFVITGLVEALLVPSDLALWPLSLYLALMQLRPWWIPYVAARKLVSPASHGPIAGDADEGGVHVTIPGSETRLDWSAIVGYKRGADCVLLYTAPNLVAMGLNRTWFASDADWQALQEVVRAHVSPTLKVPPTMRVARVVRWVLVAGLLVLSQYVLWGWLVW